MSNKAWILNEDHIELYQEFTFDEENGTNPNHVVMDVRKPIHYNVECRSNNNDISAYLSLCIPSSDMDRLAIAWCKHRDLSTNKYTLNELLEQCEDADDDIELKKLVLERDNQEELEFDNPFDIIASDADVAAELKKRSDEFLRVRESAQALNKLAPYITEIASKEDHTAALALLELLIEDYDSNVLLIDALTASINRFE